MANPLNTLTKPLQAGAKIAFGAAGKAAQVLQGLRGGGDDDSPPQQEQKQEQQQEQQRSQAPPRQRRNTQPKPLDDKTIAAKVESEIFRVEQVDKGKINVDVTDAVAFLRGEAKTPDLIKELEAKAAAIPEVKGVENLLHLPKTPAPTRADTPKPQQKTRRKSTSPAKRKVAPAGTTSERKTAAGSAAEPTPKEAAAAGEGRKPAPLGSNGDGSTGS